MNNNIGTHVNINGHVNVNDKEAGQSWALTGAMVGVGGAVEKAIVKSPIPPLQKATVIVGASVIGGISQVATNYFNKGLAGVGKSNTNIDNNISKFIDDSEFNPLQGVL
jgi:transcription termination factor NusB